MTGPLWSGEVDLRELVVPEQVSHASARHRYVAARLLVRVGGTPIGFLTLPLSEPITVSRILAAAKRELGVDDIDRELGVDDIDRERPLTVHLRASDFASPPLVSVIVCTRNRAPQLRGCLRRLGRLSHPRVEFLIVDNAPVDASTRELVASFAAVDPRFGYISEARPGLSRARNRGLALAKGSVVAYLDDDVRADRDWIEGLLRGLGGRRDVACVTGLVASASLEHPAERYFDSRVWWSSSCTPRLFDRHAGPQASAVHPYAAGRFGTGANVAFRAEVLRAIGGFDEALGAGSLSGGGEDLDVFVRLIRAGHAICYEPSALVWHHHRADASELREQMRAYGRGLSAYLFKYLYSGATALELASRAPHGIRHLSLLERRSRRASGEAGLPRALWWSEVGGIANGPWAYARARRRQSRANRLAVAP